MKLRRRGERATLANELGTDGKDVTAEAEIGAVRRTCRTEHAESIATEEYVGAVTGAEAREHVAFEVEDR